MADIYDWVTDVAPRMNARANERIKRPAIPTDPEERGKQLEFKRPRRAVIKRPAFAVDVLRDELRLRGSHHGSFELSASAESGQFGSGEERKIPGFDPKDWTI